MKISKYQSQIQNFEMKFQNNKNNAKITFKFNKIVRKNAE